MCNNGSYQLNSQWNLTGVQCNVQCPITNPSISIRPKSNNSSKSNRTPPKFSHFVLSFFSAAKLLTNSSKRPRLAILKTGFEVLMKFEVKKEFPFKMLFEATNNFSNDHKIGTGNFFLVYHADDGREVVIKCENGACACEINSKAFSCHSHNNLVCLLRFCEDSIKPIWVYEYMKNGSLHDHLHKLQSSPLMSS